MKKGCTFALAFVKKMAHRHEYEKGSTSVV